MSNQIGAGMESREALAFKAESDVMACIGCNDCMLACPLPQAKLVTIAELNVKWMEKEGPTDVLAFPMDELRPGHVNEEPEEGVLGDLVVCPVVAEQQAQAAGHAVQDELDLLTVHGILHLLGYDHGEPDDHREMFALQARLLAEWLGRDDTPAPTEL